MKKAVLLSRSSGYGKNVLGGKGKNLADMMKLGLSVPKAFAVTTEACRDYFKNNFELSQEIEHEILTAIHELEKESGKSFTGKTPLLVSVRSGAPVSMPGMMDTILNLGLNSETLKNLQKSMGNNELPYEIYIRFIEMFSEIVKGIPREELYKIKALGNSQEEIVELYKNHYFKLCGEIFPEDPKEQILMAVKSIFSSWNNERAKIYRKLNGIDEAMGTAVVVQEMVFGNYDSVSGTGVAFTRDPSSGERKLFGEYLLQAQGEDIVAGIRTPEPISSLEVQLPDVYREFTEICTLLENHYCDMQDIEFTIERGKLFILQTRNGKRTAAAAIKIAMDMVKEGILTKREAILKVDPASIPQLFSGNFQEDELKKAVLLAKGVPAAAGAVSGRVVLSSENVTKDIPAILVRHETSPEDIKGMSLARGIVTVKGGATSHGAVVARGMGKCCITGCEDIRIDEGRGVITVGRTTVKEGDFISISGYTGEIYLGEIPVLEAELGDEFQEFLSWCSQFKKLKVRMNADTPEDITAGKSMGAEGVGLCRTEHMFFKEDRILSVREMIIAENEAERKLALDKLYELQKEDFYEMMNKLQGAPFNVRLLDPPFHEFLPKNEKDINSLAELLDKHPAEIKSRIAELKEENPMLGHRGSRLAVTFPEIYEMQTTALLDSAMRCKREGTPTELEIMLPFIGGISEFKHIKENIEREAERFFERKGERVEYKLGTMMELPRACLLADEIAEESHFFSFGTNDLTQTTYGISRDDSAKFIDFYMEKNILKRDPFQSIDTRGVGKLIGFAKDLGTSSNPKIKIGVCGEHGGDPKSIEYFHSMGLNYISCSPFRVPVAIVAAAQSEILNPTLPAPMRFKKRKLNLSKLSRD